MANTINPKQAALSLGLLSAILHTASVVLVATGTYLAAIQWFKGIHFVNAAPTVLPFNGGVAVMGIIGAFIAGAVIGWLFAVLWNWVGKQKYVQK